MRPLTASFVGAVRDHLEDAGPSTATEIADRMDVHHGDVWSALVRWSERGRVCRTVQTFTEETLWWVPLDAEVRP